MIPTPNENAGPLVVPFGESSEEGAMAKLEISSSSEDDDGDSESDCDNNDEDQEYGEKVGVDAFAERAAAALKEQQQEDHPLDCCTASTADTECMQYCTSSDDSSVTSFGSNPDDGDVLEEEGDMDEPAIIVGPRQKKIFRRLRSSIKLSSLQGDIPVLTRKNSWKQLPKPDMDKIKRTVSAPSLFIEDTEEEVESPPPPRRRRRSSGVRFHDIQIRSYAQTVGDNPSVSYGPPIQLDWQFEQIEPVSVDDYEENRGDRRKPNQMGLTHYQRKVLLQDSFGHSHEEIKRAQKTADRDKFRRAVTNCFLPIRVLEDAAESGVRKTKRYLQQRRRQSAV